MSFKDIIKNSVYELFSTTASFSPMGMVTILGVTLLMGLYIYLVYRLSSRAGFYSRDLNITIAGVPVVIAAIMVAMQANLLVSMGMVGALSIVRFRTAVKNPLDLLYLFWSVSTGIICGVGLHLLAVVLCAVMTALVLLLQLVPNVRANSVLVVRADRPADWAALKGTLGKYGKNVKEKSRTVQHGETEVIFELTCTKEEELMAALQEMGCFTQISFLAHDGEFRI